ncbi:IclR family transcriptional regulator [Amycolatopsis rhabdoformis]|uniref:IclR family transcriptional regulator n=1 Tax=Amycolatopsis rhabdoformis TaxID=1448059 RepID=A0ABZ1HVG5_9PSEU|nr:IclR family transcriptional regulator [Amycolatopsis rhabdoformis]WSE26281.1 IclR family transcriptional regulator [Amycolatopsis rhabdoformis]
MAGPAEKTSAYRERNSTADRALDILGMFTDAEPVLSGNAVAGKLGVAKSTAYRYLQSLVTNRFLEEAPGGGFRLGLKVLELARIARRTYGLSEVAAPVMTELAETVHETVLLTRRSGNLVVCLDRAESQTHRVRISYERGSTLPLNAGASALALLAWSDRAEVESVLRAAPLQRFTPATLTEVDDVLDRLDRIRDDGYASTRAEVDPEVLGIAAPIRDESGAVAAAISVAALATRVAPKAEREIVDQVLAAAAKISDGLRLTTQ